jgi:hypothetical protein
VEFWEFLWCAGGQTEAMSGNHSPAECLCMHESDFAMFVRVATCNGPHDLVTAVSVNIR